jgi:hypothetical protein
MLIMEDDFTHDEHFVTLLTQSHTHTHTHTHTHRHTQTCLHEVKMRVYFFMCQIIAVILHKHSSNLNSLPTLETTVGIVIYSLFEATIFLYYDNLIVDTHKMITYCC